MRALHNRGFSLIELMIGMVAGLVLLGSATALVVSSMKANSDNLGATRLTQELRALSQTIGREIRRAGARANSLQLLAAGGPPDPATDPLVVVTINADTDCIQFRYETTDAAGVVSTRATTIALDGTQVMLGVSNAAVACADADVPVSTPLVSITALSFAPVPDAASLQGVTIFLEGELTAGSQQARAISRRYTETVYIPALVAL